MTVSLAATEFGSGTPLAILHGLFGSGRNWATIATRLAARHRVIALDLRNHGASPWADSMAYPDLAEDVRATLHRLGCRRFALLGHSMGGKAAMVLALANGAEVERLVVVDIAPVAYTARHLPLVEAMRSLDLACITRRSEADLRLAAAVPDQAERGFLLQNLIFEGGKPPRWRLNLAAIAAAMPHLAGFPALPVAVRYDGPALFVTGGKSDYVRPGHAPAIQQLFPQARIVTLPDAGHWLHAERPQAFLDIVEPFLAGA